MKRSQVAKTKGITDTMGKDATLLKDSTDKYGHGRKRPKHRRQNLPPVLTSKGN